MKNSKAENKPKLEEKPTNPDRIDDKWKPPLSITEPGSVVETYITGRKLGKGGFAVCFEGKTKSNADLFALKVVKAHIEQKKMLEKFRTELQIHAKMSHPNIVQFHKAFTFDNHTYVVLELCHNGNLTDMVKARSCLSLPEVRRFMIQICGGVKYMHKRNVIHRDLKMGNIFLDSQMNLKIGDFGLAAVVADEQDRRTTLCGTPNYIAPEILSRSSTRGHDNKVDTWAVGVICYAMLMGTPPFQSKTQQEIYTKLKTLEYEWRLDSKNYIPATAKDFVASCLNLSSAERPEMDDLVEHAFFKAGAIADVLDSTCLRQDPIWLQQADPRGDKVRFGYGVDHSAICTTAGVGRMPDGRPRPAAGEKANISALLEIEAENRRDCAPTIPLAEGVVYQQIIATAQDLPLITKQTTFLGQPRSRKAPHDSMRMKGLVKALVEVEDQEVKPSQIVPSLPARTLSSSRPAPSFAAQQRQQALPARTISRTHEPPKLTVSPMDVTGEQVEINPPRGYLRERPLRAVSSRTTRSAAREAAGEHESSRPKSRTVSEKVAKVDEQVSAANPQTLVFGTRRLASPPDGLRCLAVRPAFSVENGARAPISSSDESSKVPARVLRTTTGNSKNGQTDNEERKEVPSAAQKSTRAASPSWPVSSHGKSRLVSSSDKYNLLPNSSVASTLSAMGSLHAALLPTCQPDVGHTSRSLPCSTPRHSCHPRVDKWVDYSTRHGIAYILSDNTVGLVLKSSEDNTKPSACVVLRNGRSHTIKRAKGTERQLVPQDRHTEVEFYERQTGDGEENGMKGKRVASKAFRLDLEKHSNDTQTALVGLLEGLRGYETERAKAVGLLDKFGRYMNKVSDAENADAEEHSAPHESRRVFIEFYQRLGNVGVWGFRARDGHAGLQFNFPDHTKVVVYQDADNDEWYCDVVYLEANDARQLVKRGGLTAEAFERRGVKTFPIPALVNASGAQRDHYEEDIVRTNELREKMSWIRGVVGCWIKNRALGQMGEERIGWSGLQERREGSRVKLCWVTVGMAGGDGEGFVKK